MKTACTQVTFEFHGLFQRKVKARFDGGTITSDAGALLLREVETRTGLLWPVLALVWKDVLLDVPHAGLCSARAVFLLLTVVIFSSAFDPTPRVVALVAPGVLWVAIVFGGVVD